jgi:YD repeat-containing protein
MADAEIAATPACLTRYHYPDLGVTFDCPTVFVGGDSRHFVTTCPAEQTSRTQWHPPDRDEIELDAAGHVVHELATFQAPPNPHHPVEDTVYVYDAAGRLQDRSVTDGAGTVYFHATVVDRNPAGQPRTISFVQPPLTLNRTYPETAQSIATYGYDDLGRLNKVQDTYPAVGVLFYDRAITYDEVARRRNSMTIIDLSGLGPEFGGPGSNPMYDLLDAEGRLLEFGNLRTGEESFIDYRYDPQGRLVSEVRSGDTEARSINYVYDCP